MDSTPKVTESPFAPSASPAPTAAAADLKMAVVSSLVNHLEDQAGGKTDAGHNPQVLLQPAASDYENQLVEVRLGLASSLFTALKAKHAPTAAHCLRVALGSSSWSLNLDLTQRQRDELEVAALLHDIGKIGIPDHILLKPAQLNRDEIAVVSRHLQIGEKILQNCCDSRDLLSIVRYASAWWDGSRPGFDRHGEDLPHGARLVSIVDAFDAMTTDQVYRRAMSRERAIAELFACAGTQFDPQLVEQFCDLLTSDQVDLTARLSKRWLEELTPDQSNSLLLWRNSSQSAFAESTNTEILFHEKLLDSMHDGVVFVDTNKQIVLWNRAVERLTGLSAASVLHQRWSARLIGLRDENGVLVDSRSCPISHTLSSRVQSFRRLTMQGADHDRICLDVHMIPVIGRGGVLHGATLLLHDASSQINMQERIESLHLKATRDPLTQIANRAEFDRVLAEYVDTHLKRGVPCAMLICDIDHFKSVNDTFGHQAGDEVLISFSSLLQRAAEKGDLVARYGGEEFVVLSANCDNTMITQRAERIRRELEDTAQQCLDNRPITASFGVTEIQAGDTPETMLRRADRALLRAKESGRNRVVQLGTGIPEDLNTRRRGLLDKWLRPTPSNALLEETLVTAVPLAVTMEKLCGFVSDHFADIVSTEDGKLQLQIVKQAAQGRRASDRPISFLLSLQFLENKPQANAQSTGQSRGNSCTIIRVAIQLANARDRRLENAYEQARHLFSSLKSYFMAQSYDGSLDEEEPTHNPTLVSRLLAMLHRRSHG